MTRDLLSIVRLFACRGCYGFSFVMYHEKFLMLFYSRYDLVSVVYALVARASVRLIMSRVCLGVVHELLSKSLL